MTASYELIDSLLFLFVYSPSLRAVYVAVAASSVLTALLVFRKYSRTRVNNDKSAWKKVSGLMLALAVAVAGLLSLQHYKLLEFEDDPRCESGTVTVVYLPLWVDPALEPYMGETYQHYSSTCEQLVERISSAHWGWSRHVTLALHLVLSFLVTGLLTLCLANIVRVIKQGGLAGD